jgi:recombination protein RecT
VSDNNNDTAVAVQEQDRWAGAIVSGLSRADRMEQLYNLLGSHEAAERFKTVALHSVIHDNGLRDCDPMSVIEAVREAAVLGLEPTGVLGEAWILPYRSVARLQVGYRGYLKLIRQSRQVPFVDAQLVYMNDTFDVEFGTNPHIVHKPILFGERDPESGELVQDRGNIRGAYAWAQLEGTDVPLLEWMPLVDIEQTRKASPAVRAKRPTPWDNWYGEMARKAPIRRLAKRLPLNTRAAQALAYEEESEKVEQQVYAAAPVPALTPAKAAAVAALEARGFGHDDEERKPLTVVHEQAEEPAQEQPQPEPQAEPKAVTPAKKNSPPDAPVEPKADDELEELISRMDLGGEG